MADDNEPMSDKWLETLAREIAIPLQAHPAGPVAQIAQRNAWASLNYLVQAYQDLRAALEQEQREHADMLSIVAAVAASNPYGNWYPATNSPAGVVCRWCMERAQAPTECQHDHECTWRQARAFIAAHHVPEGEAS